MSKRTREGGSPIVSAIANCNERLSHAEFIRTMFASNEAFLRAVYVYINIYDVYIHVEAHT